MSVIDWTGGRLRVWVGETVRARVQFEDDAGQPMAAVGVSVVAKSPDNRRLTGTIVSGSGQGAFYADFLMDEPGTWFVRAACTGPTASVDEGEVEVRSSSVL